MANIKKIVGFVKLSHEQLGYLCGVDAHSILKMVEGDAAPTPRFLAILELARGADKEYRARAAKILEPEVWKPIPGYDGYEASDHGTIRRIRLFRGIAHYRLIKPNVRDDGYLRVTIWQNGKRFHRHLHRLVCLAFNGEPNGTAVFACHRDGNKRNNRAENMYWGTAAENYADQVRHGTARLLPGVKAKHPLVIAAPQKRRVKTQKPHNRKFSRPKICKPVTLSQIKNRNKIKMLKRLEANSGRGR